MISIGTPFTIYANPEPLLVSRQAVFAGLAPTGGDGVLAVFSIGQAFDSADMRAYVSHSADGGQSWGLPLPLHPGSGALVSESFKPLRLSDGRMIATGYVFHRPDAMTHIVDPDTLELLPMSNRVSWSDDDGQSWTTPRDFTIDGVGLELSGPAIQTADGRILAVGAPFHLKDTDQEGWLIESRDGGESWHRLSIFYRAPDSNIAPWEARLAELSPGQIAVIFWAYDCAGQRNLDNQIVLSDDGGKSFGPAITTGIRAQASNILPLGRDRALTIHAHREEPISLTLRALDLADGECRILSEHPILAPASEGVDTVGIKAQFGSLKFGQPALMRLAPDRIIASWWQVEDGQHVIKAAFIGLENRP